MKRAPWWVIAFVALSSTAALAADRRSGGGGCCSLVWTGILIWIFRSGGVDWLRAVGAAIFPGLFGWFIWKDEDVGTGARWVALILAIFQVLGFLALLGLLVFAGAATTAMTAPTLNLDERRELFEQGFTRRCTAGGTEQDVCACIVENARKLDDSDRKQLAFDLQQRSLAKWLETTRAACQAGKPPPKEAPAKAIPTGKDDPLGLHPLSSIASDPPGATVFVNDQQRGVTPLETPLTATERNLIRVEQPGFFADAVERTPNANEHFTVNFTLRRGATVKVTSEPAGARVLVGGKEVLAKTPGTTSLLEADVTDLVVVRDGYQASSERKLLSAGANELSFTLTQGTKVSLKSTPAAAVSVDSLPMGTTPLDVWLDPKKKHVITFSAENHSALSKTLKSVPKPTTLDVKLVDGERAALLKVVAKAQAKYDSVNSRLEKVQAQLENARGSTAALEKKLAALEREMEKATVELDKADAALKSLDEERGTPPPAPEE